MLMPLYDRAGDIRGFTALDEIDYRETVRRRWHISQPGGYPLCAVGVRLFLHNAIMRPPREMEVDHVDRNPRNNRRSNLRVCTHAQNLQNRGSVPNSLSRFRGVTFDRRRGRWVAKHKLNGRTHNLGRFHTEEEAAEAAARFRAEHMPFSIEGR
jgi:hypothetical protein